MLAKNISLNCLNILLIVGGLLLLSACSEKSVYGSISNGDHHDFVYKIQSGDELAIKFFYSPELNEDVAVRPDGRISLPLVEEIKVAGKTPEELSDFLEILYADELKLPVITVIVRTFSAQKVYVSGEVNRPKMMELTSITTVMQAIADAGGMKDTAYPDDIILIRKQQNSSPVAVSLNISKVLNGTDTSQDAILKPYDIVYVPKSPIAKVDLWVDQYIRRLIPMEFRYNF